MATIFSRIIAGEVPGTFVWKDDHAVAFLSINPLNTGHVLVVPRVEVDHWLDLEPALAGHLMSVSQAVGKALERAFSPERVGLVIAGFEVPHCHVHVVPADGMQHLDFHNAASSVDPAELERVGAQIRAALTELNYEQVAS